MKTPPKKMAFVAAMMLQQAIDDMEASTGYAKTLKNTAKAFQTQVKPLIEREYHTLNEVGQRGLGMLWDTVETLVDFILSCEVEDIAKVREVLTSLTADGTERSELFALIAAYKAGDVKIIPESDAGSITLGSRVNETSANEVEAQYESLRSQAGQVIHPKLRIAYNIQEDVTGCL